MTSRELSEWIAYDRLEPIGTDRTDLQAGIIAATVANSMRAKGRAAAPIDYMPVARAKRPPKTLDQMKQIAEGAARAFAKIAERKRRKRDVTGA